MYIYICIYKYVCICMYKYIYVYIYIKRERVKAIHQRMLEEGILDDSHTLVQV